MDEFYVKMWQQDVVIPTYETGEPEANPMFFEKRVYQGSSGAVYPYPIIEKIFDEKVDKTYPAVFLENKYIKLMILPSLGGRIQMAFDKIANRHFIYYNEVIKPALVGLCGPWISGGIEFNWPQHHRPGTFEPVDFYLQDNEDGSKTVWVNDIERMNHTKGAAGYTLYPDKAYLEVKVRLFNRTPFPQSFLWWANPAVHVNDHYQSIFPPDVHAVFDHGRRDVSDFPIAKGVYYKVNYAPGTDISGYKNIPVPTSYMAVNSAYDFVGGYEHDTHGGILHVANHHISPGKKQWTWGNGDFGKAWDRNLTDANGPYIEIMTGVFTDNQPDFSWMAPYEEKTFEQYFLPYRELGVVKNASKDLLLHISVNDGECLVKLFATSKIEQARMLVVCNSDVALDIVVDLRPEQVFSETFQLAACGDDKQLQVTIYDANGSELLTYVPEPADDKPLPAAATAPQSPQQTATNEMLYLTGLHLEQYRHAIYDPVAYYEEALRRDANDIRCNNALGMLCMKRGLLTKAETCFRKAIDRATRFNPNPRDGEPFFNLGVCLQLQHRLQEAYDHFYKATWNGAWQSNAFFALAQIDAANKNYDKALVHVERSLHLNAGNVKAMALRAFILRKQKKLQQAWQQCQDALEYDVFNLCLYYEKSKLYELRQQPSEAAMTMRKAYDIGRGDAYNFIEAAIDYSNAGAFDCALDGLQRFEIMHDQPLTSLALYYMAFYAAKLNDDDAANKYLAGARKAKNEVHFPNRLEDIDVLEAALNNFAKDHNAAFLLGCIWYDKRQYANAIKLWQQSIKIDDSHAVVHRTLAIAYFNKQQNSTGALYHFQKAFSLQPNDARILMEYDQLRKRLNHSPAGRLQTLEENLPLVEWRDDLYLERIALYNYLGRYRKAFDLLTNHWFHPWEGGEGKVPAQYKFSLVQMAKEHLQNGEYDEAINMLEQAQNYPPNLGEGKLYGTPENEIFYWLGRALEEKGDDDLASEYYAKATIGSSQPVAAIFYNDPQPDNIFYQGLAFEKRNEAAKAAAIFDSLVEYGEAHLNDRVQLDFFAVSLPDLLVFDDDLDKRNRVHCLYMTALGYLGKKDHRRAAALFNEVAMLDAMHAGARVHGQMIPAPTHKHAHDKV